MFKHEEAATLWANVGGCPYDLMRTSASAIGMGSTSRRPSYQTACCPREKRSAPIRDGKRGVQIIQIVQASQRLGSKLAQRAVGELFTCRESADIRPGADPERSVDES